MRKTLLLLTALLFMVTSIFGQVVNTNISDGEGFDGEPFIAINPTNSQNMVVAWMSDTYTSGQFLIAIKTRASFDGGNTWSTAKEMPHFGTGFGSADVSLEFDKNGLLYICYIDFREAVESGGDYIARSIDGGLTWDTPTEAFDVSDVAGKYPIDRPWFAVDKSNTPNSGTLYMTTKAAYWVAPPNRPFYKVSVDSGHTWTAIAPLDSGNYLTGNDIQQPMTTPAVTSNGKFAAVYPSYVSSQNIYPAYYMAQSYDQGQSLFYSTVIALPSTKPDTNYKTGYHLTCDFADSNKMAAVYVNAPYGEADIFVMHSNNGGQTWVGPVKVNDDLSGDGKGHDLAWANYNEQGQLLATWRDRRNASDTGFWNAGYDFYYAISNDNGQTFSANKKLTSQFVAFDSVIADKGNDFMTCEYHNDTLYSVWGDTRTGDLNIFFTKTIASTDSTTGIAVLEGNNDYLFAYPNPISDHLNLVAGNELIGKEIYLCDAGGKVLQHQIISSMNFTIQTFSLAEGVYIVRSGNRYLKIVKQ